VVLVDYIGIFFYMRQYFWPHTVYKNVLPKPLSTRPWIIPSLTSNMKSIFSYLFIYTCMYFKYIMSYHMIPTCTRRFEWPIKNLCVWRVTRNIYTTVFRVKRLNNRTRIRSLIICSPPLLSLSLSASMMCQFIILIKY